VEKLTALGFQTVLPVTDVLRWRGLDITRTDGEHGTGEIAHLMAPVSGFVLKTDDESVYIAGDTIWCPAVAQALTAHAPQVTIVNAGGARFVQGDPITMTAADVIEVCRHAPETQVIAVHLDAINHCLELRSDLQAALEKNGLHKRVRIPQDGEAAKL
jgi:L-ascorbate metabolism protein UlaG (beta-lactamase superfamily)